MKNIKIENESELIDLIHKVINDYTCIEDTNLEFDPRLTRLNIHLTGDRFHSSITTGVMKGILALQSSFYDSYALATYNEKRKLSSEEKRLLELSVKIDDGSSFLEIDVSQLIKDIGERIKKMTGKEFITALVLLALITALSLNTSKHIDAKAEAEKLRIQNEAVSSYQKNVNEAIKISFESQLSFFRAMSKQDISAMEISGIYYTPVEIANLAKTSREKRPITQELYSDNFVITDIHFEDDSIFLDVSSSNGKMIKYVNIFKDIISTDDYQWFKDSTNRQPIKMKITTTEKNGEIIAASLQSFEK